MSKKKYSDENDLFFPEPSIDKVFLIRRLIFEKIVLSCFCGKKKENAHLSQFDFIFSFCRKSARNEKTGRPMGGEPPGEHRRYRN